MKIQLSGKGCWAGKEEKTMTGRMDGLSYSSRGGPIRNLKDQVGVSSSWRNYLPMGSTKGVSKADSMAVNHNQSIQYFFRLPYKPEKILLL